MSIKKSTSGQITRSAGARPYQRPRPGTRGNNNLYYGNDDGNNHDDNDVETVQSPGPSSDWRFRPRLLTRVDNAFGFGFLSFFFSDKAESRTRRVISDESFLRPRSSPTSPRERASPPPTSSPLWYDQVVRTVVLTASFDRVTISTRSTRARSTISSIRRDVSSRFIDYCFVDQGSLKCFIRRPYKNWTFVAIRLKHFWSFIYKSIATHSHF